MSISNTNDNKTAPAKKVDGRTKEARAARAAQRGKATPAPAINRGNDFPHVSPEIAAAAPMGRGMSVTTDDLEREADSQVARERAHMDKATATEGDRRADRAQVQLLKKILGRHHGGIYKRIDENRELLELLQREAPELLAKQPWVVGWLESQDGFLCDLESAVPLTDVQFQKHPRFPRPWPTGVR